MHSIWSQKEWIQLTQTVNIERKSQNLFIFQKRVKKIAKPFHISKTCKENRKTFSSTKQNYGQRIYQNRRAQPC